MSLNLLFADILWWPMPYSLILKILRPLPVLPWFILNSWDSAWTWLKAPDQVKDLEKLSLQFSYSFLHMHILLTLAHPQEQQTTVNLLPPVSVCLSSLLTVFLVSSLYWNLLIGQKTGLESFHCWWKLFVSWLISSPFFFSDLFYIHPLNPQFVDLQI